MVLSHKLIFLGLWNSTASVKTVSHYAVTSHKTMPEVFMSFNMCVSMLFLPFSHPEESLFTQSVSANGNGHQGGGGISHHGLLWPQIMRICLQAPIASLSC